MISLLIHPLKLANVLMSVMIWKFCCNCICSVLQPRKNGEFCFSRSHGNFPVVGSNTTAKGKVWTGNGVGRSASQMVECWKPPPPASFQSQQSHPWMNYRHFFPLLPLVPLFSFFFFSCLLTSFNKHSIFRIVDQNKRNCQL